MVLPKDKPIEWAALHRELRQQIPTVVGVGEADATLTIMRVDGTDFTKTEEDLVRSVYAAHDAEAIQQARQQRVAEIQALQAQAESDEAAWSTLTTTQRLQALKGVLRLLVLRHQAGPT